jgi:SAM-dependent methyltransferase
MPDFCSYRASASEQERTADLLQLIPKNRRSVLDIGARDGHFSKILTDFFSEVVALDLKKPEFDYPGVRTVAGDATRLQFADNSFDCVFCAEVLEHLPDVEEACREIARVVRYEAIIGVPYRQDTRLGRTTCRNCGKICPPWGHVNRFDERKLAALFPGFRIDRRSYVGRWSTATNPLSTALMDLAGNPWGSYDQEEACIHCGSQLAPPPAERSAYQRAASAAAHYLTRMQQAFTPAQAKWIHLRMIRC